MNSNLPRSERQIARAKKAQAERLGQSGAFGKRKRCVRGKSCGASCIAGSKVCMVDLPWVGQSEMKKVVDTIKGLSKASKPKTPLPSRQSTDTRMAAGDVGAILANLPLDAKEIKGTMAVSQVNWNAIDLPGAKKLGEGAFGAFVAIPAKNLGSTSPKDIKDGVGIKGGKIGPDEVEALRKVGKLGIGPRLISAIVDKFEMDSWGYVTANGVIAMSRVPGESAKSVALTPEQRGSFWKMRAILHAQGGIAHNDMHNGNVILGKDGKLRLVDLGLAVISPKAALAEALGGITGKDMSMGSSFRVGSEYQTMDTNLTSRVRPAMLAAGLSEREISEVLDTGLRRSKDFFDMGVWSKFTDAQANKFTKLLYEGVL